MGSELLICGLFFVLVFFLYVLMHFSILHSRLKAPLKLYNEIAFFISRVSLKMIANIGLSFYGSG